jgi:hypothetical protein
MAATGEGIAIKPAIRIENILYAIGTYCDIGKDKGRWCAASNTVSNLKTGITSKRLRVNSQGSYFRKSRLKFVDVIQELHLVFRQSFDCDTDALACVGNPAALPMLFSKPCNKWPESDTLDIAFDFDFDCFNKISLPARQYHERSKLIF